MSSDGDRAVQKAGRDFLFAFHSALRALKLYPLENQAVQNALEEVDEAVRALSAREGGVTLQFVGNFCFVNDLRLRIDLGSYATFGTVGRALQKHGVGKLDVEPETTRREWVAVLSLLLEEGDDNDPFGRLTERLDRAGVEHIHPAPVAEAASSRTREANAREIARQTYTHSVAVAREVMTGVRIGKVVGLRRVKRAVQSIVDQVLNNEGSIVGMTVLRDYDQYTFAHSVNVCIFSIALGKKLGLTRAQLYELGVGALMHDIGKVRMPIELTTKAGSLDEPEWDLIREHPTEGLLTLLEMRGASDLPLRAMLAAYEHHMKVDLSGYPASNRQRNPTLFSRIVAVADGFDAATTRRTYQTEPSLPDAVLKEMRDNPRRGLDPLLVKAFVSMTGIYPVGSVVILDTFELAIVVEAGARKDVMHQPIVKVVFDDMGVPLPEPHTIDLSELDPVTGNPIRTIIKTTDPERYGIDVKQYFT
ncbi:MAG TPA: HD domain-containing phosphohydrolase [Longimicrobiaceae bacterium]|nr:HD domain-containing phosphohydrolase [Longimicrobiaceae bacterium]